MTKGMLLVLSAFFMCAAGCTSKRGTPPDTLVIALGAEPTTLDPRYATDANSSRIVGLMFNSLVQFGPNFEVIPDAAERWTAKDHVFTFYLRKDLRFHNGRPLTPDDVTYSFDQFRAKSAPLSPSLASIETVEAHDVEGQIQVRIQIKNGAAKFLTDVRGVRLLPKAETEAAGWAFKRKPIGTGPYKFARQDLNSIQLEATEAGATKYMVFKVVHDDFTRYQKLLKGEVDLIQTDLPTDKVQVFEQNPGFKVYRYPGLSMTYILVNFRDPLLKRKEVRQALAQTLQRAEIIRNKLQGLGLEATSILTPQNPYFNAELKNPPYDLDAAKAVIAKLGLKGRALTLKTSNAPQAVDNGRVLAHQMSASGLNIEMQSYEWATFYDDVKKGNFQLATLRWVGTIDPDIYRSVFHSKEAPRGRNRGSYANPQLDRLLDQGAEADDIAQRKRIYLEVQKIVQDDLAIIPLWYDQQVGVVRANLENYHPEPSSDFTPFIHIVKKAQP